MSADLQANCKTILINQVNTSCLRAWISNLKEDALSMLLTLVWALFDHSTCAL